MAPGGTLTECDDCAWSVCFKATGCLREYAAERGLQPNDVLDQMPTLLRVRTLTPAELKELEAEIRADRRPLIVLKSRTCLSPEGFEVLGEKLVAAIRDNTLTNPARADD